MPPGRMPLADQHQMICIDASQHDRLSVHPLQEWGGRALKLRPAGLMLGRPLLSLGQITTSRADVRGARRSWRRRRQP